MKTFLRESERGRTLCSGLAAGIFLAAATTGFGQPVITNQPLTQAVVPGTTATFTLGASGAEPLTYQWQRNLGAGFSDLADRTNASLVLTNVQTWDAWDYRVVVTNLSGARTSAVAHLYVMSPALLTNCVVIDNFNDNRLTGWSLWGPGTHSRIETNQQLILRGYWPGVITHAIVDSYALATINRSWSLAAGKTLEWRVDAVSMNDSATATKLWLYSDSSFFCYKGRDYVMIGKLFYGPDTFAVFSCEQVMLRTTNLVVSVALTKVQPNVVCTVRILDRDHPDVVFYQRIVVDTPLADPTVSTDEFERLTGMRIDLVNDAAGPPSTSGYGVGLDVWQYNDGTKPMAEAIYDNLELWTYRVPITRYVDMNSTNATPPYTNWATAARVIQDAVDAATAGDEIVVTNGTYAVGGRAAGTNLLVNRVAVDKPLTLRSVNGPEVTVIQGYRVPGTTNGDGAIRCVYLTNGASLSGFTLTNGATRTNTYYPYVDRSGGGVLCETTNTFVTNCVITDNSADGSGGGVHGGTVNNCTLTGNSALDGGGACWGTLNNCTLTSNSASDGGGGACNATLNNCTLTGNSGWGVAVSDFCRATLNNCIVYYNEPGNYSDGSWADLTCSLDYCCTVPMPTNGVGNITNAPLFVDYAAGNLRLQSNSPSINAGNNSCVTTTSDLDGNPRVVRGTVDIGAYEYQGPGSLISYAWLQQYGLPTDGSADFADPDADAHNTWQEWRCQTNPTNALSALRLLSASPAGTNVTVSWRSVAGVSYFLERGTNLASPLAPLASDLPGQPGTTSFTDTNAASLSPLFYRVGVQ